MAGTEPGSDSGRYSRAQGPESALGFESTLAAVAHSHERLLLAVQELGDGDAGEPSLLPSWTRAHVLAHLARSADALNRLVGGITGSVDPGPGSAGTGSAGPQSATVATPMYPGGPEARAAAIEEGAGRPIALLAADLDFSGRRVLMSLQNLPAGDRGATVAWRRPITAEFLPELRWREIEIHHVDLGIGYSIRDWPMEFVQAGLRSELPLLQERAPGMAVPEIDDYELLAWLVGRLHRPDLPELPAWL